MALPAQIFTGVTQGAFDKMAAEVQKDFGIAIAGPTGQASASSFTLYWHYDASGQSLTIQCIKKPWLVPTSTVQSRIANMVKQNL